TGSGCPVMFWDVFGEQGHPVRATLSEMGPLLLGRLLQLNETQAGVLNLVFRIADENGLLLLDEKDLRAMLQYVGENASAFTTQYGNISAASIGAIQRNLLALESQGADKFFAEPALNFEDLLQTDPQGHGYVNILAADKLMQSPKIYATFLLWMLSSLFEHLPEVGDPAKPKLVFFFDEAHLLFTDIPSVLLEKVEQVIRLIRSKGVGVYFVTQNRLNTAEVITQLRVGEALVSMLDEQGQPGIVERAWIMPPRSQLGPIQPEQRKRIIESSLVYGQYEKTIDRESAYERLTGAHAQPPAAQAQTPPTKEPGLLESIFGGGSSAPAGLPGNLPARGHGGRQPESLGTVMAKSAVRSIGSTIGREVIRGLMGSIFGGRRR
ncbi:MAG: DUF853 family protein, partial [Verrucomicrobia bacterium]|nr:DUF853 family protein [Verrucomicrobiota bacterium]